MKLLNYQNLTKIYESPNSLVYRAHRQADNQPVILKVLKDDYPTPDELTRYRQEYEITCHLKLPGIINAYAQEKYQNTLVIVLEDFGGESLDRLIAQKPLTLNDFLSLALPITDSLGQIHTANVIHKDINPSNIVFNPETKQLKIIDFGISTALPRENPTLKNPNQLEGTLAYLSPEQTGRMNRAMDYRTDFYALGVTFYELLTHRLPFETDDVMALVHCHLAKQPLPPCELNPDIPKVISDIILKLLSKNAEDRYQSAWGLKADLQKCDASFSLHSQIAPFTLAQQDFSNQFQIPQKLYGRESETQTYLDTFKQVCNGMTQIMLVAGYSGIGKSALVQEICKPITEKRGYFISGKFDQYQRNIPYSALFNAFSDLVRQLLSENETQLNSWKNQLLQSLGPNGQVILEVIPELEQIIGPQPSVPTLGPTEAQNRFNLVFQNFIRVFGQPTHPLVIFLDDLQWVDSATLKLIELIMTMGDIRYLFLIGAFRDNEVSPTHPLIMTLEGLRKQAVVINQVTLAPLKFEHVTQLVADTLHNGMQTVKPLAELVSQKTGGNPFFINQFLKTLYDESLLNFELNSLSWRWDMAQIEAINITKNVVELMARKLQKLSSSTQRVLSKAACVGNHFDLKTLAIIHEKSLTDTYPDILAAIQKGLILPISKLETTALVDDAQLVIIHFKFLHDRVQQAAYALIADEQKPAVHLQIGRLMLENTSEAGREEQIFDLVGQLNVGIELIVQQSERNQLAQLNLIAGKKAKVSAAYKPAFDYFQTGIGLLGQENWQTQYDLTLALYVEAVEAAYLSGDFEQMEQWAEIVLQRASGLLDKVKIYEIKIQAYHARHQLQEAIKMGLHALRLLGIRFPESPRKGHILLEVLRTKLTLFGFQLWKGKRIEDLIDLPEMTELNHKAAMRVMASVVGSTYLVKPELMILIVLKMVNLSIKYGNTHESALGYSGYALILCDLLDIETGYQFGELALKLSEKFNAKDVRTLFVVNAYIKPWKQHLRETRNPLLETYQSGLDTGNFEFAIYSLHIESDYSSLIGLELSEVDKKMDSHRQEISKIKQETPLDWLKHSFVLNLMGHSEMPCQLTNNGQLLQKYVKNNERVFIFDLCCFTLILCYLFELYSQALEQATQAEEKLDGTVGLSHVAIFHLYDSLVRLAVYSDAKKSEQKRLLKKVATNQKKMKKWAHHAPMNFLHKFYLVEAERHRVLGNDAKAMDLYDQAIALAEENEYRNEKALAYELAAKFYLARDKNNIAKTYLRDAHYAYTLWGAKAKVKHLETRYPQFFDKIQSSGSATTRTTVTGETVSSTLDLASVLKASQAIAGEIELKRLLEKLMRIVIENAGAQRGCLILEKQGQWIIEASSAIDREEMTVLQSIPIEQGAAHISVPITLINYVVHAKEKENVVLRNATQEGQFTLDPYIVEHRIKSVLCVPLLNQGQLIGLLYLENNLAEGAFTSDRLEVLNLLSAQIAISLENSILYNQLDKKVVERTRELEQEIVERKRAEETAKMANQAKSIFLANMSHELRTPLTPILGFAQLMSRNHDLSAEHQENIGIIRRSGEHLLTLINDVLDMSKIEAGRITLNENDFDFYRLLDDVKEMFQFKANDKQLQLLFDRSTNVPRYVRADELKLRQVLINLLGNAIKFTQEGNVQLSVISYQLSENSNLADDSEPSQSPKCKIFFEVEDTGPGIAPDKLDTIFETFEQIQTGLETQEGTGLGLPISQQFVQLMGGKLIVSSEVGKGTTFKFEIVVNVVTAADIQSQPAARKVIALEPGQEHYRILIVDDKEDNRQFFRKLLNSLGFELWEATNGVEAIEVWEKFEPHLTWMDLRMPVMDGYETTKRIKATIKGQATAIIALTACTLEEERAVALSAGCDDFLRKPFKENDIFDLMNKHLGVRYVYEELKVSQTQTTALTSEALSVLPASFLADLYDAAEGNDDNAILELLEQIRPAQAPLADTIAALVTDYNFDELLALMNEAKNK